MGAVAYVVRLALVEGGLPAGARLAALVALGALVYLGLLVWRQPGLVAEARALIPRRAR